MGMEKNGFSKPSLDTHIIIIGHNDARNIPQEVTSTLIWLGYNHVRYFDGGFRSWKQKEAVAFPKSEVVTYDEVVAALSRDDIIVLDVRTEKELQQNGEIPGSVNIPLNRIHR